MFRFVIFFLLSLASFRASQAQTAAPCPNAININTNYRFRDALHFICLQPDARIDVIKYPDRRPLVSRKITELGSNKLSSFVDDSGTLRILVANPHKVNGTTMLSIDNQLRQSQEIHTVNTQRVSALNIWRLNLNMEWQLAVANQPIYLGGASVTPSFYFYSWKSTYFDEYHKVERLPFDGYVTKIEPFLVNGQEFVAVTVTKEEEEAKSLIYKLDFGDGNLKWNHHQIIDVRNALDVKAFKITHRDSLQEEFYLALINGSQLTIFKYFNNEFIKIDTISSAGTKLDTITYGRGDTYAFIGVLTNNNIELYIYDGLTLNRLASPTSMIANNSQTHNPSHVHLHMFRMPAQTNTNTSYAKRTLDDELLDIAGLTITVTPPMTENDTNDSSQIFPITPPDVIVKEDLGGNTNDSTHSKRSNVGQDMSYLLGWCQQTLDSILSDNFDLQEKHVLSLPRLDQRHPIELHGDLIIDNDLHITNSLYTNKIQEGRQPRDIYVPIHNYTDTFHRIEMVHQQIDQLAERANLILVDDGTTQHVFNPMTFETIVVECPGSTMPPNPNFPYTCPIVKNLQARVLNGRDISNLTQVAMLTGRPMTISQDVRFEHLILRGPTDIAHTVNGLRIDDIIFKRGDTSDPVVYGPKKFENGLYSLIDVHTSTWHNLTRIDRKNYLLSHEDQRIESNLHFHHVVLDPSKKNYSFIDRINKRQLSRYLDQIALDDANLTISTPIKINELILNGPVSLRQNSLVSNVNIDDLWRNAMFKRANQNISAFIDFATDVHVSYGGDMIVYGLVNGVPINQQTVLMRDRSYNITNPVIFERDVAIKDLTVLKALNRIQVFPNFETGRPEVSILYNIGTQHISSDKILNDIRLGGNSFITGHINGNLNLTHLHALAYNQGDPFRFPILRLNHENIRPDPNIQIFIDSSINGINVRDFCDAAIRARQSQQVRHRKLRFGDVVHFRSLKCGSINRFKDLSKSFLTRYGNQYVAGTLKLVGGAVFNTSVAVRANLNGLNVGPLASAVSEAVRESQTRHKVIRGDLYIDDLIANRINDLLLSRVLLAKSDSPQYITAPVTFDHLDIENMLVIEGGLYTNKFNNLNVSEVLTNTLQYDAPQVIYNHLELTNLQIMPNSNLLTQSINNQNLKWLYTDSVLVDLPQQILAPKVFVGSSEFGAPVSMRHGLEDVSENELLFNCILHGTELIDEDLEFNQNDVIVRGTLDVDSGLVNDIDLNEFVSKILHEGRGSLTVVGNGSVRFKDVNLNNLSVSGKIQGIDLSREAILRSDNSNGTYDADLKYQQMISNNRRLLSSIYSPNTSIRVSSNYLNRDFAGLCRMHSCTRSTPPLPPSPTPPMIRPVVYEPTRPPIILNSPQPVRVPPPPPPQSLALPLISGPRYQSGPAVGPPHWAPHSLVAPNPYTLVNVSRFDVQWSPSWNTVQVPKPVDNSYRPPISALVAPNPPDNQNSLIDTQLAEHYSRLQALAIKQLATRINPYLSASFYYDHVQKHPILGPVLCSADNPTSAGNSSSMLILKSTSNPGEPCHPSEQSLSVLIPTMHGNSVTSYQVNSMMFETSNPTVAAPVVVGKEHYLLVLDAYPVGELSYSSSMKFYMWDRTGRYELKQSVTIEGVPNTMKVFVTRGKICALFASPRLGYMGNFRGEPFLLCQSANQMFGPKITLNMSGVYDLDTAQHPLRPDSMVVAALSRGHAEGAGDLIVANVIFGQGDDARLEVLSHKKLNRPIKVHIIKRVTADPSLQIVAAEGLSSIDTTQTYTRIFALRFGGQQPGSNLQFYESQAIKDNQFNDVQSVRLDNNRALLIMQSAHSLSLYAPIVTHVACDPHYTLIQKVPTKGANKFHVFNANKSGPWTENGLISHFLILSRDDCERQQYSTIVLRAVFN